MNEGATIRRRRPACYPRSRHVVNWININTATLRAPEFIGSAPPERGTWLCVLGYSLEQENSGVIEGAGGWSCRQWQQTCGVTLREVKAAKKLLVWTGEDLQVRFYPLDKQAEVLAKREGGRKGGLASGKERAKQPPSSPSSSASPDAASTARTEGNGREENGRESIEGAGAPSHADASARPPSSPQEGDAFSEKKEKGGGAFAVFWAAYPNKKAKLEAKRAWDTLHRTRKLPRIGVILHAIAAQKCSRAWEEGFIPHPATWLRRGSWDDISEVATAEAAAGAAPAAPAPDRWEAAAQALYPGCDVSCGWHGLTADTQAAILEFLKKESGGAQ